MVCSYCAENYEVPAGFVGIVERTWADRGWDVPASEFIAAPTRVLVYQAAGTATIPYHLIDLEGTPVIHECRNGHSLN